MWAWGVGGLAAAGGLAFVLAGGPGCHCGPCLGRAAAAEPATVRQLPPPRVRFDEPPLARALRTPPVAVVPAAHAEPADRYSSPADPF
jgi:hypothetical protein